MAWLGKAKCGDINAAPDSWQHSVVASHPFFEENTSKEGPLYRIGFYMRRGFYMTRLIEALSVGLSPRVLPSSGLPC